GMGLGLVATAKFSHLLLPLRGGTLAFFRRIVAALSEPAPERLRIVQVGSQGRHHQIPAHQGKYRGVTKLTERNSSTAKWKKAGLTHSARLVTAPDLPNPPF